MYDPFTNTYSVKVSGITGGWYAGGALLPDGTVALIPTAAANIGIYNPVTNSFTTVVINGTNVSHSGPKVLPNGLLFMSSYNWAGNRNGIYNYLTKTYVSVSAAGSGTQLSQGVALLFDGRIILPPFLNISRMGVITGFTPAVPPDFVLHPLFNHGG
jgi:hypothetical protein